MAAAECCSWPDRYAGVVLKSLQAGSLRLLVSSAAAGPAFSSHPKHRLIPVGGIEVH